MKRTAAKGAPRQRPLLHGECAAWVFLIALGSQASACLPVSEETCDPRGAPSVPERPNLELQVGDDDDPFEPYREGSTARLVRGPQGGFMLVLRAELGGGPAGERVCGRMRATVEPLEGGQPAAGSTPWLWTSFSEEGRTQWEDFQVLLGFREEAWRGRRVRLRARFEAEGWLGAHKVEPLLVQ